jgi:hypothetical protein
MHMTDIELLDNLEIRIKPETVLKLQGYEGKREPLAGIRKIVTEQVNVARKLAQPRAIYREIEIKTIDGSAIRLADDSVMQVGKRIAAWWQGSTKLAIALCTVGSALEDQVKALSQKGEHLAAMTLDACGSLVLGSALDQVNRFTCERASKEGIRAGPSLNPGYAEWPLTDQRLIFQIMPAQTIGIRLNEQCMMSPKQSATICTGLGVTQNFDEFNRCYHCGIPKCPFRKLIKKLEPDTRTT